MVGRMGLLAVGNWVLPWSPIFGWLDLRFWSGGGYMGQVAAFNILCECCRHPYTEVRSRVAPHELGFTSNYDKNKYTLCADFITSFFCLLLLVIQTANFVQLSTVTPLPYCAREIAFDDRISTWHSFHIESVVAVDFHTANTLTIANVLVIGLISSWTDPHHATLHSSYRAVYQYFLDGSKIVQPDHLEIQYHYLSPQVKY